MITYNDLYEYARKERYSKQLQKLPKNFVQSFSEYISEKKQMTSKEDDAFSDTSIKNKKQMENAITLFKELVLRRRRKLLDLVLIASETGISKQDFDNMLDFEKSLFEELMKNIEISDKKLNQSLNGSNEETEKNDLIVFKEDVDELVGFDGNKIGPFKKGQIANIPKDIAKIIVDDGKAEIVEK